jgi:ArsR family transcriptional regulator
MKPIDPKIMRFFSTLADETRLKILVSLSKGPLTVNQIHHELGENTLTLSAISHQLKLMSNLDIVAFEKKGRNKFYSLSNKYCWCILKQAFDYFKERKPCPHCANIATIGGIR